MRCFLLYIDDWLSSKQIARMDAAEERGYLRLLMYAATEEDCGLPNNPNELANVSLLGRQWFKPTADKSKRIGAETSGEKILACFVERTGRLYNERLLKEFEHQREVRSAKSASGKLGNEARWGSQKKEDAIPNGSQMRSHMASQNDPNDVCVSASVLEISKKEEAKPVPAVSPGFASWWPRWSAVRGSNHEGFALRAWLSVVTAENELDVFACTESYLASIEGPKGYNPETFLFDQARDGYKARWPARSRGQPKKEQGNRDFDERINHAMEGRKKLSG